MSQNRDDLIKELTELVNKRENKKFTTDEVSFYIGTEMTDEKLNQWVEDTAEDSEPVTASDIEAILDGH